MVKKHIFIITLILLVFGFALSFYLQDLKHRESTTASWKANRHNMDRFNEIKKFTNQMNRHNWNTMRDSINNQLDTLIILRFRKELDSLNFIRNDE